MTWCAIIVHVLLVLCFHYSLTSYSCQATKKAQGRQQQQTTGGKVEQGPRQAAEAERQNDTAKSEPSKQQ
ncbi:hypothetical protein PRUPE_7G154000 [Prunus persica]|uniref:Secreted protein n=1 Tax=Prunus persica TaxID=3760 RepID=A0A251NBW2_PRUPE|nr:hypothetical protein PRUPE_7G154000 [Prunus persica]